MTPFSHTVPIPPHPSRLTAHAFPRDAISLKQTGVPVGGALAGALMPGLLALAGWRWAALAASIACVLMAATLEPVRRRFESAQVAHTPDHHVSVVHALQLVMRQPRLRALALASFTYSGMQSCLGYFLVVYLHDRVGFGIGTAGLALSVAMVAGIAGRILWGLAADRLVQPRFLLGVLGAAMSAAAFLTAALTPAWPVAMIFVVIVMFGVTAVGWNGVYISEAARITASAGIGAATGASLALAYAGVVSMPLVFLALVQTTGSYAMAYVAAGCLTLWRAAVLLWPNVRRSAA